MRSWSAVEEDDVGRGGAIEGRATAHGGLGRSPDVLAPVGQALGALDLGDLAGRSVAEGALRALRRGGAGDEEADVRLRAAAGGLDSWRNELERIRDSRTADTPNR